MHTVRGPVQALCWGALEPVIKRLVSVHLKGMLAKQHEKENAACAVDVVCSGRVTVWIRQKPRRHAEQRAALICWKAGPTLRRS